MYGLAYVILPFSEANPGEAITSSLARYRRGRADDLPLDWLRFHDETADVVELHTSSFEFTINGSGLDFRGGDTWLLDSRAVMDHMEARDLRTWTVRFADLEPNLDRFAARFVLPMDRHPVTGGYGRWLNGLGRWDWWELGGRFDGVITGERTRSGRRRSNVSSGPSDGRDLLEAIEDELSAASDQPAPEPLDVRSDINVELVATLASRLTGDPGRLPHALVLPPGSLTDEERWCGTWPELGPRETVRDLTGRNDADWRTVLAAAYARFADHWAAGVAFHL